MAACMKHGTKVPTIQITNFQPNDTITYAITLIKGLISNYTHVDNLEVQAIVGGNIVDSSSISRNGEFKAIVQLSPGINHLIIAFCCIKRSITINYAHQTQRKCHVKTFYIICKDHDGCFQSPFASNSAETACRKINLAMALVQCLYAEMLVNAGFPRKTFEFSECQPFSSKLDLNAARQWSSHQLWQHHAKEILCAEMNQSDNASKFVGVLSCTKCESGEIKGSAAHGIGDFAVIGGGTLFTWPDEVSSIRKCLENDAVVDKMRYVDDSNGRGTFGGCFSTALGTICHEIGHIFDLGHTNDGIMGSDIDYVHRVFICERFPWNLPKRSCYSMSLVTANAPRGLRITSVKKSNSFLSTYHQRNASDLTFLTENCAALLNYHKWFNQFNSVGYSMKYDEKKGLIVSRWLIRLVEIRAQATGMCILFHHFAENTESTEFSIPSEFNGRNMMTVVVDQFGNIEKFFVK